MKKILLVLTLGILIVNPVSALTRFQIDYSALLVESPSYYVETAPVNLKMEVETVASDFSKLDSQTAGRFDRQVMTVLADRKELLETKAIPKIDEASISRTLGDYKAFRESQIRNEIQNPALQNDELGILYREVDEYELQLRVELVNYINVEMRTWEREYANLEADMADFVDYNKTLATRAGTIDEDPRVTESKIIDVITENKEDFSKSVDTIEESQSTLLTRLVTSNEKEDNSLIVDRNDQLIKTIESDQDILNTKLANLEEEKNTIDALSREIDLMEVALKTDDADALGDNPYAEMSTTDLVILREESSSELESSLSTYESTQNDVQETLAASISNLRTLELKN